MTFSSADYPLFLMAVFAIYALSRLRGAGGALGRIGVLALLGDLVYLLLCKDVGALWDPLGAAVFGKLAVEHHVAPPWHFLIGTPVLIGAAWSGWRYGGALAGPRGQRGVAFGALAGVVGLGVAVWVTHHTGALDAMSAGFQSIGHLLFLTVFGFAIGAAQTERGQPLGRVVVLLVASTIFYHAWASAQVGAYRYLLLVLVAIVVGDFLLGLAIARTEHRLARKGLLLLSLCSNLGVLGLFKYFDFFTIDVMHVRDVPLHLILPAGISFHTFQSLSYTIDVYRKQIPPCRSVVQFATFVLFFPQLVAGPIVRAHELLPQMDDLPALDGKLAADGLFRIVVGLFKKIALADLLARVIVDRVFESPGRFSGLEVALGVIGYAFQIYCDFSAYSDIAIGSAQVLGFRFPENFATPYRSGNLQEFWRRWHMTLSSWLRDYLYIPLGGARRGNARTYVNLTVTMLLGGLWHGASWTFVTWGALHGLGLAVTRVFQRIKDRGGSLVPSIVGASLLASIGLALQRLVLPSEGMVVALVIAWVYLSPLWAVTTVVLTAGDAPTRVVVPVAVVVPPAAKKPAKKHHRPHKKKRSRQRGAIALPHASTVIVVLRALAAIAGLGALVSFVVWTTAPIYVARGVVEGTAAVAVPPPGEVLPFAIVAWTLALLADLVEARPDLAFARRWAIWAIKRGLGVALTFSYVCLAWIFFRATSFENASSVLSQIATWSTDTHDLLPQVKIVLGVAAMAHVFAPATFRTLREGFVRLPFWAQGLLLVGVVFALRPLAASTAAQFIYFQF